MLGAGEDFALAAKDGRRQMPSEPPPGVELPSRLLRRWYSLSLPGYHREQVLGIAWPRGGENLSPFNGCRAAAEKAFYSHLRISRSRTPLLPV